jgi:broad specificity phosphatase PhoE
VQQATRLGQHFASSAVHFTHIFSSQLKRAVKTAELVRTAQPVVKDEHGVTIVPVVAQITELAEKDFGSYEGVPFLARPPGSKVSGKDAHRALHKDDPGFVDSESNDSMICRVDVFIDTYLAPIVQDQATPSLCVAVVSHGITLSVLWKRILARLTPKSVTTRPDLSAAQTKAVDTDQLPRWSNTGYLELIISYSPVAISHDATAQGSAPLCPDEQDQQATRSVDAPQSLQLTSEVIVSAEKVHNAAESAENAIAIGLKPHTTTTILYGWSVQVCAVNSTIHLLGLKRTGGGVGSSRHDDKQKSIDTFFKRRKT